MKNGWEPGLPGMSARVVLGTLLLALPWPVLAHSFGKIYNLPVPIWMYLYGAAAALLVSFLMVGYFVNTGSAAANFRTIPLDRWEFWRSVDSRAARATLRTISVLGLLLTIATGLFGKNNAYQNFNMTFFWIIFILGFTYLTAMIGNAYAAINPWLAIVESIERRWPRAFAGRRPYPAARWAYYPALILYIAFIWVELFGRTRPLSLSVILIGYSGITFAGAFWFGKAAWFRYGEFLAVFFRMIGLMAPFHYVEEDGRRRLKLRQPFTGLLSERVEHLSLLLFILFMLSSTAFDGIKDTVFWVKIFWKHIFQALLPHVGGNMIQVYPYFQKAYAVWQTAALALSPYFYLGLYLFFIWLAKKITRSTASLMDLALTFGYSLIPIAFVYNITHYYTLIATQGSQIVRLVSDPFGYGWDIFATRRWLMAPVTLDAGVVWHTQVWLILFGHIVSVYLAHIEALKAFPTQRQASLSQLPMLLLMVAFTTIGLWILSMPINSGQISQPG
jgi:hypothetical protein